MTTRPPHVARRTPAGSHRGVLDVDGSLPVPARLVLVFVLMLDFDFDLDLDPAVSSARSPLCISPFPRSHPAGPGHGVVPCPG
ncbi:hypothetical protein MXD61_03370 [Frankia sp. AgPm24]|uniref:hypothetical protein n=1 Tax=Frankia sp. AgPm24 TaxID=631128 RepID=UPI00200FB22F|nr:hypothetical protein [Frankia sp. AgPm24]MCK9920954.1 hypothetical protein [Frankia sp. AgPm24]